MLNCKKKMIMKNIHKYLFFEVKSRIIFFIDKPCFSCIRNCVLSGHLQGLLYLNLYFLKVYQNSDNKYAESNYFCQDEPCSKRFTSEI